MSTIQNLKNFIRHGKQARQPQQHAEPTTKVASVHAQGQPHVDHRQALHQGISEPAQMDAPNYGHHAANPGGDYSVNPVDQRNVAAQAHGAAAAVAGQNQKIHDSKGAKNQKDVDSAVLERIVAEERESKGKLPRYPGLDRFKLLEKMGDGAFSNVYRAKDLSGEWNEVAIKVVRKFEMNANQGDAHLHPDFKKQPKVVERANILKEVQIMRQLDHPNVVKLISFSESSQYYFIVLELCPGGELFHQIVRLTYFSEDLSRHVILQVAKALEYLHEEKGVVHRDIKPENLLFYPAPFIPTRNPKPRGPDDEDKADEGEYVPGIGAGGIGQIKIADFGLSKVVWDTVTQTPCGTVGYTAPEIVKDERYSKSVDMWALGCVLYTLLCGFPPFYDESIQVLTEKVARGQYTFLSPWWDDISKSAQDLVSHLLTVDPDKRYTIKEFLNHPWIRESAEPTQAAADAPPLATPLVQRMKQAKDQGLSEDLASAQWLETPGGGQRRMDFRSPGAVNLREVFDVGYAVHRQAEEGKRRKLDGNGLNDIEEDEGRGRDVNNLDARLRNTSLNQPSAAAQARQAAALAKQQPQTQQRGYGQHSPAVAAAARSAVGKKNKAPFELSLDGATLLGRRGKANGQTSSLREEIVQ